MLKMCMKKIVKIVETVVCQKSLKQLSSMLVFLGLKCFNI